MAKTSQIHRDLKRNRLIDQHAAKRAELRKQLKDPELDFDEKMRIQAEFAKMPRNSCPTRRTRRCAMTGRSRSVYRRFQLSRIKLRELALQGQIPGMTKASW